MNIVLGVTGSIAAYKAADIISRLKKLGHNIDVILTESGSKIITPLTLQTLSKNKVYMDMFEEITPQEVKHISLAEKADLVLIAPATANIIGKIAHGIADDFLSTVVMAAANQAPIYIAPAMNTNMYENPIVQENIEKLKISSWLPVYRTKRIHAGMRHTGKGALADVDVIVDIVEGSMK